MTNELHDRLATYHAQVRNLWLKEIPLIALIAATVVFGLTWLLVTTTDGPKTGPGAIDWRLGAACIWLVLMVPPIRLMYPERPTEESIEHDSVLNALGECEGAIASSYLHRLGKAQDLDPEVILANTNTLRVPPLPRN